MLCRIATKLHMYTRGDCGYRLVPHMRDLRVLHPVIEPIMSHGGVVILWDTAVSKLKVQCMRVD